MNTERSKREVIIVGSGGANILSLTAALDRLDVRSRLSTEPDEIRAAAAVILPGVGAAADAMQRLRTLGLDRVLPELHQPVLGICLGMQLLASSSAEDDADCLGIVPDRAVRLEPAADRPVPHMGWNRVSKRPDSALLAGIPDGAHFYFIHSYALPVSESTTGETQYGMRFASVFEHRNFYATQFHPERSSVYGAEVLRNFLGLAS